MITMGCDPGTSNFAIVVLDARGRVSFAKMLKSTIRSMSMHKADQRPKFRRTFRRILLHTRPDEMLTETFVARGFGTSLSEFVNIMIGSMMCECDHQNVEEHATMASSWKLDVGRHYAWPDFSPSSKPKENSKLAMNHLYAYGFTHRVPMHLVDATCIASYLRHGKSFATVDWSRVRWNIARIAGMIPEDDLVREGTTLRVKKPKKRVTTDEVPAPAKRGRRKQLPTPIVLAEPTRRVRGRGRGKRDAAADGRATPAPRDRGGERRARGARKA